MRCKKGGVVARVIFSSGFSSISKNTVNNLVVAACDLPHMSPDEEEEQPLSKMATTIDNSNAVQATKKKHLGIPEAVFVVRKL